MLIFGNLRIFFLISLRKTVSVVKKLSADITQFFAGHWPMSDASIQACTLRKDEQPLTDMRLIEKEKKCIEAVVCRSCSKKVLLKCRQFDRKTPLLGRFLIKFKHRYFPMKFVKFLRTAFLTNTFVCCF